MQNKLKTISERLRFASKKLALFSLIATILTASLFVYAPVHAEGEAQWGDESKGSIFYNQKTYYRASDQEKNSLPNDIKSSKFIFISKSGLDNSNQQTIEVLTLSNDETTSSAKYHKFKADLGGKFTKDGDSQDVPITGVSEARSSSCAVEGGGGWVICTLANTLASWMDSLYNIVQAFLDVQPLQVTSRSAIFQVWSYMRNIANVLFVIAFIVVIYSQITNAGISNYGIKRMLPKLIVAAILINLSYYICAIFIDLSNIIGHQLQNLLISIRKDIFQNPEHVIDASGPVWKTITTAVLSGAGGVVWGTTAYFAAGGVVGSTLLLLASLVGVIFSAFVALVILAARQAIITVLVFLAPLAFAANILPNTEKWFEKWKDLLTTMLVMYPIFALLFGGAQLAGTTIIANAGGNMVTLILGLVVQVIPLAITPFIIRLSGSLLGRFAGIVNNPSKGLVDRSQNSLRKQAAYSKNRVIAKGLREDKLVQDGKRKGKPRLGSVAWGNQLAYNRQQKHASMQSVAEDSQKAAYNRKQQSIIENANTNTDPAKRDRILKRSQAWQQHEAKIMLEASSVKADNAISQLSADIAKETFTFDAKGNIIGVDADKVRELNKTMGARSANLYNAMNELNAAKLASANNNAVMASQLAQSLKGTPELQDTAAGARGEEGRYMALASAFATINKTNEEEVKSLQALMKSMSFSKVEQAQIIHGKEIQLDKKGNIDYDKDGNIKYVMENGKPKQLDQLSKDGMQFKITDNLKQAALPDFMARASMDEALSTLEMTGTGGELHDIRASVVKAYGDSGKKADAPWVGGAFLDKVATEGIGAGEAHKALAAGFEGKLSDETVMSASNETLQLLADSFANKPGTMQGFHKEVTSQVEGIIRTISSINRDSQKYAKINNKEGAELHRIINEIKTTHSADFARVTKEIEAELKLDNPDATLDMNFSNIKNTKP